MSESIATGITRRRFLNLAGAAAAVLALPSSLFGFDLHTGNLTGRRLKIGVLLPASRIYPLMTESFLDGMTLSFGKISPAADSHDFIKEEISSHIPYQEFKALAEKRQVDLITGLFNTRVASVLSDSLPGGHIPLVSSSMGECIRTDNKKNPSLFHCSLDYWQANWAMGRWAAGNLGKRAFVASSFYESGFDGIHAFRCGFESSGGSILETRISHMHGAPGLVDILGEAGMLKPDFVYALYCGPEAGEFIDAYAASPLSGRVPLAGSPFLTDENVLKETGASAAGIKTCFPWAVSLDTPENSEFVTAFTAMRGRKPDAFALLGYETAGLIAAALGHSRLSDGLREAGFRGPRGLVKLAAGSEMPLNRLFIREVDILGGMPVNRILSRVEKIADRECLIGELTAEARSGWNNPYMCV